MNKAELIALLLTLARLAIILLAVLAGSWLLSFLSPGVVRILEATRNAIRGVRLKVQTDLLPVLGGRVERSWQSQSMEPRAPVAAELRRVADAVEHAGSHQIGALRDLQTRISDDLALVQTISLAPREGADLDLQKLREGAHKARENLWLAFLLLFLTVAFGTTNSFLLNLFFRETLGPVRVLPTLFPDLQASHILAVLMAVMEVAAGIVLHLTEEVGTDSGTARFMRTVPWLGVFALMLVEIVAYALLSSRIDLATRLSLSSTSAFYGIVQYFLAFFGAVITLLLFALGYQLWKSWQGYLSGRRDTHALRGLGSYSKSLQAIKGKVERLGARFDQLKQHVASFEADLLHSFQNAIGVRSEASNVAAQVRDALVPMFEAHGSKGKSEPPVVRSRSQMTADFLVNLLLLLLWVILLYLNAENVRSYLGSLDANQRGLVSLGGAWAVAVSISAFGYLLRDAHLATRYASVSAGVMPERSGRRVLVYATGIGFLLGMYIDAAVSVLSQSLGDSFVLNATYGVFLALALATVSVYVDGALLAAVRLAHLVFMGAGALVLLAYQVASLVAEAALFLTAQVVKVLSIPGDWLRTRKLQPVT